MGKHTESESNQAEVLSAENNQPLLDKLLKQNRQPAPESIAMRYAYTLIGQLSAFDHTGYAIVEFFIEGKHYNFKANTTIALSPEQVGESCVMVFNQGNIEEPIIIGLLQQPESIDKLTSDDKPIVIHSEAGIVLKCGASRIELNAEGTINIQGMHINNQAYGPNRIKGGSVKIN